ncbi:MAG: hypothetical protein ABSH05_17075 [Bryobacteraceae bacterium]|jgi:hypothetical protein
MQTYFIIVTRDAAKMQKLTGYRRSCLLLYCADHNRTIDTAKPIALVLLLASGLPAADADLLTKPWQARWISVPGAPPFDYGVYLFRRAFELASKPDSFTIRITADNRYQLFANGERVGGGPARGDLNHWRYETYDILVRDGDRWLIAAQRKATAWVATEDPFHKTSRTVSPPSPVANSPICAYCGADGVLRVFTGDATVLPQHKDRDSMYCWEIDPDDGFPVVKRHTVYDTVAASLPIRPGASPKVDMCKLLPHGGGATQYIVNCVSVRSFNHLYIGSTVRSLGKSLSSTIRKRPPAPFTTPHSRTTRAIPRCGSSRGVEVRHDRPEPPPVPDLGSSRRKHGRRPRFPGGSHRSALVLAGIPRWLQSFARAVSGCGWAPE